MFVTLRLASSPTHSHVPPPPSNPNQNIKLKFIHSICPIRQSVNLEANQTGQPQLTKELRNQAWQFSFIPLDLFILSSLQVIQIIFYPICMHFTLRFCFRIKYFHVIKTLLSNEIRTFFFRFIVTPYYQ